MDLTKIYMLAATFLIMLAGAFGFMYYAMGGLVKSSDEFATAYLEDPDSFDVFEISAADIVHAEHSSLEKAISGRVVRMRQEGTAFAKSLPKVACITDQDGGVRTFRTSDERESNGDISLMAEMFGRDTVAPLVDASICQKVMARTAS